MRLAHLILAHHMPEQLERLVRRISHKDADIYIHLNKNTDATLFSRIKSIPNVVFIAKREPVVWGEYTTVQATINGMEEILATGKKYTHINLLSGADYPLKSNEHIHEFLFANTGKTFMWYEPVYESWHHGQARMNNYDFGDYGFPGRYFLSGLASKILPARKLPNKLVAYGRSQWLTITPECAQYTLDYIKANPNVARFFRMTWASDEVFFQTILCNSPLRDTIVNDNLRYIALTPEFRPVNYTMEHGPALLSSGKLYARKFDSGVDADIFDYLDKANMPV